MTGELFLKCTLIISHLLLMWCPNGKESALGARKKKISSTIVSINITQGKKSMILFIYFPFLLMILYGHLKKAEK